MHVHHLPYLYRISRYPCNRPCQIRTIPHIHHTVAADIPAAVIYCDGGGTGGPHGQEKEKEGGGKGSCAQSYRFSFDSNMHLDHTPYPHSIYPALQSPGPYKCVPDVPHTIAADITWIVSLSQILKFNEFYT